MGIKESELERLEKLAESFSNMGNFTQIMRETYSRLESEFEDVNGRLARVNELLRASLEERNRLANYLKNILESVDSGVIVTDRSGAINIFNSSAERYTGISAKSALGRNYHNVLGKAASPDVEPVLRGKKSSASGERQLHSKDGIVIPVAYSITRLRHFGDEHMTGMVEILYDLTEIKKLEDNLKKISTLAALGEMAATVAHEIRNPLAGISGFASLLLRDLSDDSENYKTAEKISKGVASLNVIVENLLDFTKTIAPNAMDIDLVPFLENAVVDFRADSETINHTIEIRHDFKKLMVRLDPDLFRQIIFNLVKNAVQTQPDGGRVHLILTKSPPSNLILRVEDDGPGIPENALEKIFNPFFTTKTNGIGLGLATVKKLVELHGGRVMAGNMTEGGAVFTVEIPNSVKGDSHET